MTVVCSSSLSLLYILGEIQWYTRVWHFCLNNHWLQGSVVSNGFHVFPVRLGEVVKGVTYCLSTWKLKTERKKTPKLRDKATRSILTRSRINKRFLNSLKLVSETLIFWGNGSAQSLLQDSCSQSYSPLSPHSHLKTGSAECYKDGDPLWFPYSSSADCGRKVCKWPSIEWRDSHCSQEWCSKETWATLKSVNTCFTITVSYLQTMSV